MIEARAHYSTAQLNADFRELFMTRYLDPEAAKEPPRPRQPWTAEELLPWFAWFEQTPMTTEQAASLAEHFDDLPEWAKSVAPIDEARALTTPN